MPPLPIPLYIISGRGECRRHLDQVRTRYEAPKLGSRKDGDKAGSENIQGGEQPTTAVSPDSREPTLDLFGEQPTVAASPDSQEPAMHMDLVQTPLVPSVTSATTEGSGEMPMRGTSLKANSEPCRRSKRRHTPPDRYGFLWGGV